MSKIDAAFLLVAFMVLALLLLIVPGSPASSITQPQTAPAINFADADPACSGSWNGLSVTLTNAPNPPASLVLTINGLVMSDGVDYTITGPVVTLFQPTGGNSPVIRCSYRY